MAESKVDMVDAYFMDARSKLIDIAAFMDRVERLGGAEDYRYQEFVRALSALDSSNRAATVLNMLSDPTTEPCEKAGLSPAAGAYKKA